MNLPPDWSIQLFPSSLDSSFLRDEFTFYNQWVEAGYHAEMAYLASTRHVIPRSDPAQLFPGLKSILSARFSYPHPDSFASSANTSATGRIASYAWIEDYHNWIPGFLDEQMERLATESGQRFQWKVFVDSAPILERSLGQSSGLGWIGKNSCLITVGKGSFQFLAEVFTDLEPDKLTGLSKRIHSSGVDRCGSCRRCLDACPTGCITNDRSIDSRRCISYLTIEHKGLPACELRPLLGNWIFGCDICQQVCPWNQRFAAHTPLLELAIPTPYPELVTELYLTDADFKQKYDKSPVSRAKRRGYLRNVCIALGNVGNNSAIPTLLELLRSEEEPLVRAAAVWAIKRIDLAGAQSILKDARQIETHPMVLDEFEQAFMK
jgi:epoxyqueuosine reductase